MEDNETEGTGVASVLAAIASDRKDPVVQPDAATSPEQVSTSTRKTPQPNAGQKGERPKARIGRFPGSKNGAPKERFSAHITPELKDAYVNWALDDRCTLSELMERALTEFYQRHRATSAKRT